MGNNVDYWIEMQIAPPLFDCEYTMVWTIDYFRMFHMWIMIWNRGWSYIEVYCVAQALMYIL